MQDCRPQGPAPCLPISRDASENPSRTPRDLRSPVWSSACLQNMWGARAQKRGGGGWQWQLVSTLRKNKARAVVLPVEPSGGPCSQHAQGSPQVRTDRGSLGAPGPSICQPQHTAVPWYQCPAEARGRQRRDSCRTFLCVRPGGAVHTSCPPPHGAQSHSLTELQGRLGGAGRGCRRRSLHSHREERTCCLGGTQ